MRKLKVKQAIKHLAKLRKMIAENPSPIFKMNKKDVIKAMRKTREQIWKEKIAFRH